MDSYKTTVEEVYEKALYEYWSEPKIIFRVTMSHISRQVDDKYKIRCGEPLEIVEYKGHVIIHFNDEVIAYTKISWDYTDYLELKHICYEGIMYRFRSFRLGYYYLMTFDDSGLSLMGDVGIPVEDFKVMTACDLLKKYLKSIGSAFDKGLVDHGIIIYRKYWDPISALGLIRNRLHDLIVVAGE